MNQLEAAAQQSPPGLAQLQASNLRLREALAASLAQVDALIARYGAEPWA